jgi:argininosuccinate lyase
MAKKLWGGRFGKKSDSLVEEFTKSIDYDYKLAEYDVTGSMIHVNILKEIGFLGEKEANKLYAALNRILKQIESGTFEYDRESEDIHTNIQNLLEQDNDVGDLALKLHTARSRNDQVLFDLKLFCKLKLLEISQFCSLLQTSLLKSCIELKKIIIPGYTHLQHAQLVSLSDYLKSYVEMLKRDKNRLYSLAKKIQLTLGAGALAGIPIPSKVYNRKVKEFLRSIGGRKITAILKPPTNSLDTISDRDFVIETLSALAILGMHLSRFSEDLIIWSTREFGFVELDDAFSTGSSLMPQKKNPDVLELIRGYTGTLYGNLVSVLTMMKGLPLTYNRDMQLDKSPLFNSFEIIEKELKVLPGLIETLKWNRKRIADTIKGDGTLYATDWVYHLVKKKKVPFKTAHDIIGKLVKKIIAKKGIKNVSKIEMKKISDKLIKSEILKLMNPKKSVKSRISVHRSK